jgi:transposase
VYLMVVHFIPAHRCVALLESLTGAAPSVGFVHGMLARTAALLDAADKRIRTLITLAYAGVLRRDSAEGRAAHSQAG